MSRRALPGAYSVVKELRAATAKPSLIAASSHRYFTPGRACAHLLLSGVGVWLRPRFRLDDPHAVTFDEPQFVHV